MKKLSFLILLSFLLLGPTFQVIAQDTVSTKGVSFSDGKSAAPAANKTVLKKSDSNQTKDHGVKNPRAKNKETSLWTIFITGLLGGFAALLMPCIFPMLPMTVSFFTKGASERSKGVGKAMLYGISIIVIYVVLVLAITVCFGADALNSLSTNGVFNFAFFLNIYV